jgi:hypothetical protein
MEIRYYRARQYHGFQIVEHESVPVFHVMKRARKLETHMMKLVKELGRDLQE